MTGEEYKKLSIDKRVDFINSELEKGNSLSHIFKELGVSKSQSGIIKRNGYDFINNKYIKNIEQQEEQINFPKVKEITFKKTGRPLSSIEKSSVTLNLNKKEYKVLQVYALLNNTNVSDIVNNFMHEFIKEKNLNLDIYMKK